MNTLFTSDSHFSHSRIIEYCNRPFNDVAEMNEQLINNWNSVCDDNSVVYHLGDFHLGPARDINSIIYRLKFKHLHFIKGNHDKSFMEWYAKAPVKNNITVYNSYLETKIDGSNFTLCHYALRVWNKSHHGSYHLYGHSHGTLPDDPNSHSFDVGVDCHSYTPVTLGRVREIMEKKQFRSIDHHGSNQ